MTGTSAVEKAVAGAEKNGKEFLFPIISLRPL